MSKRLSIRKSGLALAGVLLGTLAACSVPTSFHLPPLPSAQGQTDAGRFVWFELVAEDVGPAKTFYSEVFGWQFDDEVGADVGYALITSGGTPIGGISELEPHQADPVAPGEDEDEDEEKPLDAARRALLHPNRTGSAWIAVLSVADVDRAAADVVSGEGLLQFGPIEVEGRGRLALVTDSRGAMLALLRSKRGDPPAFGSRAGGWIWAELWTDDPDKAAPFYERLAGFRLASASGTGGRPYRVFVQNGQLRGGVVRIPIKGIRPNWVPYVGVTDLEGTIGRAERAGGRIAARGADAAILLDPNGAAIGVQRASAGPGVDPGAGAIAPAGESAP